MGYSVDLRLAAVKRYPESGDTYAETGKIFGVDASSVQRRVQQYKETGDLSDKPMNRGFKKFECRLMPLLKPGTLIIYG